jgi:hypothetical protein
MLFVIHGRIITRQNEDKVSAACAARDKRSLRASRLISRADAKDSVLCVKPPVGAPTP